MNLYYVIAGMMNILITGHVNAYMTVMCNPFGLNKRGEWTRGAFIEWDTDSTCERTARLAHSDNLLLPPLPPDTAPPPSSFIFEGLYRWPDLHTMLDVIAILGLAVAVAILVWAATYGNCSHLLYFWCKWWVDGLVLHVVWLVILSAVKMNTDKRGTEKNGTGEVKISLDMKVKISLEIRVIVRSLTYAKLTSSNVSIYVLCHSFLSPKLYTFFLVLHSCVIVFKSNFSE